jgi:hypothetical protein
MSLSERMCVKNMKTNIKTATQNHNDQKNERRFIFKKYKPKKKIDWKEKTSR